MERCKKKLLTIDYGKKKRENKLNAITIWDIEK
jgi:hypothetical protein